jgi:hypothetical protein
VRRRGEQERRGGPVLDAKLAQDPFDVLFDGARLRVEDEADLEVGLAARQPERDLKLARYFSMRMLRGQKRLMPRLPTNVGALDVPVLVVEGAHALAAGLVISLSALAMVPVVGEQMEAALRERGVPPLSTGAMAYFIVQSFTFGVLLVWLYAAVQPRLAPGPKTAALVATLVWFVGYCSANVSNVMYGFMPVSLTVVGTL